jgi:hypothetical protein
MSAQNTAAPDRIQWGKPRGHLQIGWEPIPAEFHQGDPITLKMHLRVADDNVKVKVMSAGVLLDLYSVAVSYGPNRVPVAMTEEGMAEMDPYRSMGAKGADMDTRMVRVDEIRLSEWWDVSRPGLYTVYIAHKQRAAANTGEYAVIWAPNISFRVIPR